MTKAKQGYLGTKEVTARYSISRTTLYRRVEANRFPSPTGKAGKGNWWPIEVLDEFDRMCRERSLKSARIAAGNV